MTITGVVQGVGFRPNVARLAAEFAVSGLCGNDDQSVFIEAQGEAPVVEAFCQAVVDQAPPLATIVSVAYHPLEPVPGEPGFRIVASRRAAGAITLIPPDTAVCPDCLADMADPTNRRYRYPFTTCTNCGPRLSIIRDVPYDRPLTTMADFEMCPACRREYTDPADRRYHAQPISCFDCGPDIWLEMSGQPQPVAPDGAPVERRARVEAMVDLAQQLLRQGQILAVKGIGGFTLMCDARNETAVARLRTRKHRPGKPLAVMTGSVAAATALADFGQAGLAALTSQAAPIVLAPMAAGYDLAASVAPGLDDVGVMLAYAPLHRLLLGPDDVVVATSANSSSKPLTYRNEDARRDLSGIVDAFLMHNRDIYVPVEDSVVMADGDQISPVRRSRGYAPLPVALGRGDHCVLAVGAELKNTFALTRDGLAFLSAHIGDMGSLETQQAYVASVDQMLTAHRRSPELIVVDKHPGYASHAWGLRQAERADRPVLEIQHHHAHALALVAEGELALPAVCLVLDGTGYGDDATIWGGEVLRLGEDPLEYDRIGHLPQFWLPGGDSAVRAPWKSALGLLWEYAIDPATVPAWQPPAGSPDEAGDRPAEPPGRPSAEDVALVMSQLRAGVNLVRTTSAGRLFDAAAALLGVCQQVTYEAQAAMELEAVARRCPHAHRPGPLPLEGLIGQLIDGCQAGQPTPCLARLFHAGLAAVLAELVCQVDPAGTVVGLTGGVFANRLLSGDLIAELARRGRQVVRHRGVPPNDGGLALGQALAGSLWCAQALPALVRRPEGHGVITSCS